MQRVLLSALIVGLSICMPVTAADVYYAAGYVASATFRSLDEHNVETFVYVVAQKGRETSPPEYRKAGSKLFYYAYRYDYTTGLYHFGSVGEKELMPGEFDIDLDLSQATLNTTVVLDSGVQPITLTVQLDFAATSSPTKVKRSFHEHSPDRLMQIRYSATERQADVAGSVLNGQDNLTPGEPLSALIYKVSNFEAIVR